MNEKEKKIILATVRLFASEGLAVPTAKIAEEAGVSNGTLFNYFPTKQDLIDSAYFFIKERIANETIGTINTSASMERVSRYIWEHFIAWALDNPLEHKVVNLLRVAEAPSAEVLEAVDHFFAFIYENMEQGVRSNIIKNAPIDYLCELAGAQLNVTISYAKQNNMTGQVLKQHIDRSFDIYWHGIRA